MNLSLKGSADIQDFNLRRVFFCFRKHGRLFQQNLPKADSQIRRTTHSSSTQCFLSNITRRVFELPVDAAILLSLHFDEMLRQLTATRQRFNDAALLYNTTLTANAQSCQFGF